MYKFLLSLRIWWMYYGYKQCYINTQIYHWQRNFWNYSIKNSTFFQILFVCKWSLYVCTHACILFVWIGQVLHIAWNSVSLIHCCMCQWSLYSGLQWLYCLCLPPSFGCSGIKDKHSPCQLLLRFGGPEISYQAFVASVLHSAPRKQILKNE